MWVEVITFRPSKIVGFRLILVARLPTLRCWSVAICNQILKMRLLKPFWSSSGQALNLLPYHPVTTAPISWDIANLSTGSVAASALPIPCLRRRFPHANFEQNSSLLFTELSSSILVGLLGKTNSLSSRDGVIGTLVLALLQELSGTSESMLRLWFRYENVDEVSYISIPVSSYLSCNIL